MAIVVQSSMVNHLAMNFKFSFCFIVIFISCFIVKAQVSGTGCRIGDNVYTQFLGNGPYYGNTSDMVAVYNLNGPKLTVINGQGYSGYRCGYINVYSGGTRWNGTSNVAYPGVNEVLGTVSTNSCMVSTSTSVSNGGKGNIIQYEINNPNYCSTVPVPLDDYIFPIMICIGGLSAYFISKKAHLA